MFCIIIPCEGGTVPNGIFSEQTDASAALRKYVKTGIIEER